MIRFQDLTVEDVMSPGARCLHMECTALGAASFLLGDGITGAPVVDDQGELCGVVSTTDLLGLLLEGFEAAGVPQDPAALSEAARTHLTEVLKRPPVTCTEGTSLVDACRTMIRARVHRLVVIREGAPVGVLSAIDLVRALAALGERATMERKSADPLVSDWMSRSALCLGPDEPVIRALETMAEERVRHVLVTQGERLLGIVSNRDVMRATSGHPELRLDFQNHTLRGVMTPAPLHTIGPDAALAEAAELMCRHRVSALPVLDQRGLLGLITSKDVLSAATRACPAPSVTAVG